jgi:hypothetical protein
LRLREVDDVEAAGVHHALVPDVASYADDGEPRCPVFSRATARRLVD